MFLICIFLGHFFFPYILGSTFSPLPRIPLNDSYIFCVQAHAPQHNLKLPADKIPAATKNSNFPLYCTNPSVSPLKTASHSDKQHPSTPHNVLSVPAKLLKPAAAAIFPVPAAV